MGKKSKRNRSNKQKQENNTASTPNKKEEENINNGNNELENKNTAPSLRSKEKVEEEETKDNLKFEDPYEDIFIEEEESMVVSDEEQQQQDYKTRTVNLEEEKEEEEKIQSWTPLNNEENNKEEIEITPEAYKLYFNLTTEWPCLSFDIINDNLGYNRKKFPHSLTAVIGTQADYDRNNKITVLKLKDLGKMKNDNNDEDDSDDELNSDSDSDSDDEDHEPTLEYYSMKHDGGVNRLRVLQPTPEQQQQQQIDQTIVATWSSKGIVNLYNVSPLIDKFDMSNYKPGNNNKGGDANRPFFVYSGHNTEGYAMNFHKKDYGTLATGDCSGAIHIWNYNNNNNSYYYDQNSWSVDPYYKSEYSIEDIQWSPTENTVLCSAECNGYINIYDTRCKGRSMIHTLISSNYKDINVVSWNQKVTNLLATGTDDGVFSVWDLRTFSSSSDKGKNDDSLKPLARFQPCKKPITSLEWHPTDESMIIVSDEDTTYVYDLSVEVDDDQQANKLDDNENNNIDVPPQMLFMHCGNQMTKEVHWHNQISSLVMTTSLNGFNVFIPSNL